MPLNTTSANQLLTERILGNGHITVLTGAGMSAVSGIPTFRGRGGFWTIGSQDYHPRKMATFAMFCWNPEAVWWVVPVRRPTDRRNAPVAEMRRLRELASPSRAFWFDETYNERHYHYFSALETAKRTRLLITVGTAGATTLPHRIVKRVLSDGGLMFDINVADNPFAGLAMQLDRGIFIRRASGEALVAPGRTIASVKSNL